MQLDYEQERFTKTRACGIECDFSDLRIDRKTVPEGSCQYEVADMDENQADLARVGIVIREAVSISSWIFTIVYKTQCI